MIDRDLLSRYGRLHLWHESRKAEHETLCFYNDPLDGSYTDLCICDRLKAVRIEERERIVRGQE